MLLIHEDTVHQTRAALSCCDLTHSQYWPRNRFEKAQIMAYSPGKRPVAHKQVIGFETNSKKIAGVGNSWHIGPQLRDETKILVKNI
jgi:hypothetical protein